MESREGGGCGEEGIISGQEELCMEQPGGFDGLSVARWCWTGGM